MIKRQNFWYGVQAFILTLMGMSPFFTTSHREWLSEHEQEQSSKGKKFIVINKFVLDRGTNLYIRRYELWLK